MSATPLYLLPTKNDASANPVHILTNGKASVGSNSSALVDGSGIISTCSLNIGTSINPTNINVYGTYFSNNGSALLLPADISANRPAGQTGYIRFNTTINYLEYWDSTSSTWIPIVPPPYILSISPTSVTQSNIPISIFGGNFNAGSTVQFIDNANNVFASPLVTFVSPFNITALTPTPPLSVSGQPFSIKVTVPAGLSALLPGALSTGAGPVFITTAGNIGNIYTGVSSELLSYTNNLLTVKAIDPDSDPITYSYTGSLPPGLSLDASGNIIGIYNGVINSPSASPTSTVYTFNILAITPNHTSTRTFNINVIQPTLVSYAYTGSASVYPIPTGVLYMTTKMWAAGGANYYNSGYSYYSYGAPGGFTETTFNIVSAETNLTIVVAGGGGTGTGSYESYGYGGGGNGANGGSGGGGASIVLSGNITTPFANSTSGSNYTYNAPQASLLALNGAEGVIAVAGGGGGAGWYIYNTAGGTGGGITGGTVPSGTDPVVGSFGGYTLPTGGTQSSGGTGGSGGQGNYNAAASKFAGGKVTANTGGGGGSGGGGGGWYGGGCYQTSVTGNNAAGGGGSGFAGYANGTTYSSPTYLTGSNVTINSITYPDSYQDNTTRTNGTRIYKNTKILRSPNLTYVYSNSKTLPPLTTDTYYTADVGTSGPTVTSLGGNGKVVLIF